MESLVQMLGERYRTRAVWSPEGTRYEGRNYLPRVSITGART